MSVFYVIRLVRALALASVMLLGSQFAAAVPAAQFQAAFDEFVLARVGSSAAIERAAVTFASLQQVEPANPVVMAYAGATTAMLANTTWLPWKKLRHAEDGLALLDKSLAMLTPAHNAPLQHELPAALEVRYVAASTFLAVPGFMNRAARGARLLQEVADSPLLASSPLSFRVDVWMAAAHQATADKRLDEARRYLNEVVKASGPQLDAARAQLKAMPS